MKPVITLDRIVLSHAGRTVLRDISLDIEEGAFTGIVGPNGGGKTTLLKVILGIIKPDSGSVSVMNEPPCHWWGRGTIGYLPQRSTIDPLFPATALDVVMMGFSKRDYSKKRGLELLSIFDVERLADSRYGSLSGGEQQRVSIARALAGDPSILLLDEPSTGVDVVGQDDFYILLKDIRAKRTLTVIMVSHDIGAVSAFVDDIACLNVSVHYHGRPDGINESGLMTRLYGRDVDLIHHHHECVGCQRVGGRDV